MKSALRRALVLAMATAVLLVAAPVGRAQTSIAVIREAAEAIGVAGDSLGKVAEGFDKLIATGTKTYDTFAARKARAHLVDLSARITDLRMAQNIRVVESLEEYVEAPSPAAWKQVNERLGMVLGAVQGLLVDVRAERSDFVLTPGYEQMMASLTGRVGVLQKLLALPPPTTPEELAALRVANEKYKALIDNLGKANAALSRYIQGG